MRSLAHIERIEWVKPIENADKIELVGVLGWQCVAKKNEFKEGDKCVYIEIDSIVDKNNPDFAFLEDRKFKIKTIKLRGQISQGIVFPLADILHDKKDYPIGEDLTEYLKIREIEDDIPKPKKTDLLSAFKKKHPKLMKHKFFKWAVKKKWFQKLFIHIKPNSYPFPDWIAKTDEVRIQNKPEIIEKYKSVHFIVTEKIDGTSGTFAIDANNEFIVCSRNKRLRIPKDKEDTEDVYNEIARKYNIKDVLLSIKDLYNCQKVVLQGEIVGPGIQGNKYNFNEHILFAFNLIIDGRKLSSTEGKETTEEFYINWVPIVETDFTLLHSVDEMIKLADGKSKLCDTLREGLVIRSYDNSVSFKIISNKFLLKHNL